MQGRTQGKGPGFPAPPPLGTWKNTAFSGFLPLNYVNHIFEVCFLCFLLCGRTEEACSMVNSLRIVDLFAPYWPLYMGKIRPPPLRNPEGVDGVRGRHQKHVSCNAITGGVTIKASSHVVNYCERQRWRWRWRTKVGT